MSRVLLSEMERRRIVVATRILLGFVVCLIWALVPILAGAQGTPLNETDLAAEADHCIIVYPIDMAVVIFQGAFKPSFSFTCGTISIT